MTKQVILSMNKLTKRLKVMNNKPEGFSKEELEQREYYFESGLRKVIPYFFTFTTYCKGRWYGKRLVDVYQNEFRMCSTEEYKNKILNGDICVNNKIVDLNYILKNGDILQSKIHRHETPINTTQIDILINNENYIAVNKPTSVPVHPCGNFRVNSLLFMLAKEHGENALYPAYRIDRLTSGLVIFAKNLESYVKIQKEMVNKTVNKEYLCLVDGIFYREPQVCEVPIKVYSYKIGISAICESKNGELNEGAKQCKTRFERIAVIAIPRGIKDLRSSGTSKATATNNNQDDHSNHKPEYDFVSLLKVSPVTGRTHQIRVHAQYLGHPILNDPLYNTTLGWGKLKGKGGLYFRPIGEVIRDLIISSNYKVSKDCEPDDNSLDLSPLLHDTEILDENSSKLLNHNISNLSTNPVFENLSAPLLSPQANNNNSLIPDWYVEGCFECVKDVINNHQIISTTPPSLQKHLVAEVEEKQMYLHCFKYSGTDWNFQTPLPYWAADIKELLLENSFSTSTIKKMHECFYTDLKNSDDKDTSHLNKNIIIDCLKKHPDSHRYDESCDSLYLVNDPKQLNLYHEDFNPLLRHLKKPV